jgi:hypothetical protein
LQRRDVAAQQQSEAARNAQQKADAVAAQSAQQQQESATLRETVNDLRANATTTNLNIQETQKLVNESPSTIRFRGITLTPGGFLDATGIIRSHNENSDIGSTFGNIPFSGSANSRLSEFRMSARHSRISLLGEGKVNDWKITGYYETDFLGAAPTANEVESNSFNLRQRQLWGQIELNNGNTFSAGQTWSLITTGKKGITLRQESVPMTPDAQYVVGFTWARQMNVRFTHNFDNKVWVAFAAENPETTLSVLNPPANVFGFNNSANATSPGSQFTLNNSPGANGVSTDLAPDLIAKVAFEPGWGHYEIKALGRFFRDRFSGNNNYTEGGGIGWGMILPVTKKADFIWDGLAGVGIGRYAAGVGTDATLRPDGTIVPVHAIQSRIGAEVHPTSKLDLYVYGGEEYYQRASYVDSTGKGVGYGSTLANLSGCSLEAPSAAQPCQANTRNLWQVQPGYWYRMYKGTAGTVQLGMSYSYTYKSTWAAATSPSPKAIENMVMTSFRYVLP